MMRSGFVRRQQQLTDYGNQNILDKIAGFVGKSGLNNLRALIRSCPQLKKAALSLECLSQTNVGKERDFPYWSRPSSKMNKLFCQLVRAKNPSALYIYGIRLAFTLGELDAGLYIMKDLQEDSAYSRLMFIMLSHCAGLDARKEERLYRNKRSLEEINKMGHAIMRHISAVGPRKADTFKESWYYEDFPTCSSYHEYMDDMMGRRCEECVLWELSIAVRTMS